ncbi:MAG: hypothetical protein Q9202_000435 [Teloschistes flavicans]
MDLYPDMNPRVPPHPRAARNMMQPQGSSINHELAQAVNDLARQPGNPLYDAILAGGVHPDQAWMLVRAEMQQVFPVHLADFLGPRAYADLAGHHFVHTECSMILLRESGIMVHTTTPDGDTDMGIIDSNARPAGVARRLHPILRSDSNVPGLSVEVKQRKEILGGSRQMRRWGWVAFSSRAFSGITTDKFWDCFKVPMRNIHDTIRGELPHAFNNSNPRHREKLPAMNPGRNPPTRAHPDYGNPDLTRAVLAAARRPGHPLYEEVKKRGKSPYEVWMVVAEVRYTIWVEGRECWLDAVVENVRAGMTRGHGHKHGEDRGQGGDRPGLPIHTPPGVGLDYEKSTVEQRHEVVPARVQNGAVVAIYVAIGPSSRS